MLHALLDATQHAVERGKAELVQSLYNMLL